MTFSAVILAGGKSSRMGCDKAFLEVDGQPLLARQIQLVRAASAREVFISGRDGVDYSEFGCAVLQDRVADAGPLAGIEAALAGATSPLLLVLAVDMPEMSAEFLRRLLAECANGCGAIPRVGGFIEPLAAFYPKAAVELLSDRLEACPTTEMRPVKSPSAKHFAERCVAAGLARFDNLPATDARHFANWNSPADLPCRS